MSYKLCIFYRVRISDTSTVEDCYISDFALDELQNGEARDFKTEAHAFYSQVYTETVGWSVNKIRQCTKILGVTVLVQNPA